MLNITFQIAKVVGKYTKKDFSTRWLSLKFAGVRLLEQWQNLTEYFFKIPLETKILKEPLKK